MSTLIGVALALFGEGQEYCGRCNSRHVDQGISGMNQTTRVVVSAVVSKFFEEGAGRRKISDGTVLHGSWRLPYISMLSEVNLNKLSPYNT